MSQADKDASQVTEPSPAAEQAAFEPPGIENLRLFLPDKRKRAPAAGDNRRVVMIGAGVAPVLVLLALNGLSRRSSGVTTEKNNRHTSAPGEDSRSAPPESLTPILDAGRSTAEDSPENSVDAEQLARMASKRSDLAQPVNLGVAPPFPAPRSPQVQPFDDDASLAARDSVPKREDAKAGRENPDRPSLIFSSKEASFGLSSQASVASDPGREIHLEPGTRLRARLEAAVSSAVHAPVVAVVEYDYERNGDIVIPAGAKVIGRLEGADRAGYVEVHFDALSISDMPPLRLDGVATDLQLRPLRGRVEGRNTGKNLFVRSAAGIGQIAATFAGRGSLDQPLSESDLLRERLSNNIGQAGDQQVAGLALSRQTVVTLPAGTEIYVVLGKLVSEPTLPERGLAKAPSQANAEELRQLLQLQRELNESTTGPNH